MKMGKVENDFAKAILIFFFSVLNDYTVIIINQIDLSNIYQFSNLLYSVQYDDLTI